MDSTSAGSHHDLGVIYAKSGDLGKAIDCFRRAIELQPASPSAYANLGRAFFEKNRLVESVASLRKAVRLGASTSEIHNNLGVALSNLPDPGAAEECFWGALRITPEHGDAHYNLARVLLIQGKFCQGWQEYEWRWKWRAERANTRSIKRKWAGEPLQGKRILLFAEQGLRDTIVQIYQLGQAMRRSRHSAMPTGIGRVVQGKRFGRRSDRSGYKFASRSGSSPDEFTGSPWHNTRNHSGHDSLFACSSRIGFEDERTLGNRATIQGGNRLARESQTSRRQKAIHFIGCI